MNIVIIGAGAAGMTCAHYLAAKNRVTVLERRPVPGGNICTLNRNISTNQLPEGVFVDNGVIEFHREHSHALRTLMGELGLELTVIAGGSTGLYLEDGRSFHMPGAIRDQQLPLHKRLRRYGSLAWCMRHLLPIGLKIMRHRSDPVANVGHILGQNLMSDWMKMLLMYGYSIPYQQIDQFPARLAIPTLLQGSPGTQWVRLNGGVYRYIEAIIERAGSQLDLRTGETVRSVARNSDRVLVECDSGVIEADKVIFATPPDQVLELLADADENERSWFSPWRANHIETLIHTDSSLYEPWNITAFSEFDLFEKEGGKEAGYNAWLNRLCDIEENSGVDYFLAYNLEDRINPAKIIDRQKHHTPLYTAQAMQSVDRIKAANGRNNTWHAGAYLANGLHEGAIQSAQAVKKMISDS
jgi:predicted NAD/FAD-binding protein